MKILITGFSPFGGDKTNASLEAVKALPDSVGSAELIKAELPVEYGSVARALSELIAAHSPDAVICTGQAGGRAAVTPEKIAVNWKYSKAPDNAGVKYDGEKICPDGPDAYFSTLPVEDMTKAIAVAGVPADVSFTAGTYVCNCTMYSLLYMLSSAGENIPAGFIHVPCERSQAKDGEPFLTLAEMTDALKAAISVIAG